MTTKSRWYLDRVLNGFQADPEVTERPWRPRASRFFTSSTGIYLNGALYLAGRGVSFPFNIELSGTYEFLEDLA